MAKTDQKDLFFPDDAPPAYITTHQGMNDSETITIITLPEVNENIPSGEIILTLSEATTNDPNGGQGTDPLVDSLSFNDKSIRQGFIRKVYTLIVVQLLITCAVIAWFMHDHNLQYFVRKHLKLFLMGTLTVYLSTALMIWLCEGPRRRVPYNFLCLFAFTLALSALVGVVCSTMRFQEVLVAGGVTMGIFVALTLFAFQTKIDFTTMSGSLLSVFLVFSLFGILMLTTPFDTLRLLYCGIGVLLMCLYIVYDTQLMMCGLHRYTLSPEEYVFAALNLYIDIMYIFVRLLQMIR